MNVLPHLLCFVKTARTASSPRLQNHSTYLEGRKKKKHQELCLRIKRLKFTKQTLLERMRLGEQVLNIHILPNIVKQYEIYVYSKVPDSLTWH